MAQHQIRTTTFMVGASLFELVAMHRATAGTEDCQDASASAREYSPFVKLQASRVIELGTS